jgi:phosphoserine phosphatase
VALLDVDGTLLPATCAYLFARELVKRGLLPRGVLRRALVQGLRHRLGWLDYPRLAVEGARALGHVPYPELQRLAYETFAAEISPRLYPGVLDHLNQLRAGGTRLVLLSSSPGFVLEPLGAYLGCAAVLSTPLRIERHRVTGVEPDHGAYCYGAGKAHYASRWLEAHGLGWPDAVAYTDHWTDRHVLLAAGGGVVVRPGPRLRRLARRRGWRVVDAR